MFLFVIFSACATENKAKEDWDKCAENAVESTPADVGIAGGVAAISAQCGERPVVVTAKGSRLLLSDCNWLYEHPFHECKEQINKGFCKNGDDIDMFSMSSWRDMSDFSNKAFNKQDFFNLCRQVCLSESAPPSRVSFGKLICGE